MADLVKVKALRQLYGSYGLKKGGDVFSVAPDLAEDLEARGLIVRVNEPKPEVKPEVKPAEQKATGPTENKAIQPPVNKATPVSSK